MNKTITDLKDWRSYRKFYAQRGESMHPYYQARHEEAPINSMIVIGSIILAVFIIILNIIF